VHLLKNLGKVMPEADVREDLEALEHPCVSRRAAPIAATGSGRREGLPSVTTLHSVGGARPKLVVAYLSHAQPLIESDLTDCLSGGFPS
jgi:hypothetical protein